MIPYLDSFSRIQGKFVCVYHNFSKFETKIYFRMWSTNVCCISKDSPYLRKEFNRRYYN